MSFVEKSPKVKFYMYAQESYQVTVVLSVLSEVWFISGKTIPASTCQLAHV